MKKRIALAILVTLLVTLVFAAHALASQLPASLSASWKDGSTATAVWAEVEGADYYQVRLNVSYQGTLLGSVVTGTAATELDVQQEANSVLESDKYDVLQLTYTVAAGSLNEQGGMVYGAESELSPVWDYELTLVQLTPPENITLYEDGTITWQPVTGADHYSVWASGYAADGSSGTHTCQTTYIGTLNDEGLLTCNIKNFFDILYKNVKPGQEQPIMVYVQLASWSGNSALYMDSEYSQPTDAVEYVISEIYQLTPPQQVTLSEDGTITWEMVENTDHYSLSLLGYAVDEPEWETSYQTTLPGTVDENGMVSCNLYEALCSIYKNLYREGTTSAVITAQVGAWASDSSPYVDSDYSAPSEAILFAMPELTQLEPPTGIVLDEEGNVTWNSVPGADHYGLFAYGYIGDTMNMDDVRYCQTSYPAGTAGQEHETQNILDFFNDMYTNLRPDMGGSINICVQVGSWVEPVSPYLESGLSDYSNVVQYNPFKSVEAITLSPEAPALYVGNSLYMGKTITPEDAYYTHIDWQGGDEAVLIVSDEGMITGVAPGVSEVVATIGDVSQSAVVTVYDISSNIEDPEEEEAVTDEAGDIIDDIVNNDVPNLDGTDIPEENLDEIRDDIQQGLWRGDEFFTDITWLEENFGKYKNNWGQIQKAARELNAQFGGAYNIEVEMYHKDDSGKDYHIGHITELENEITFTFDLPTGMKEVQAGYARKYVLVRIHMNEMDTVNVTVGEDSFSAKSDTFSDFVLLYVDTPLKPVDLTGYDTLQLPDSLRKITAESLAGTNAQVIVVPETCTAVSSRAFAGCKRLVYIVVSPEAELTFADDALEDCAATVLYQ